MTAEKNKGMVTRLFQRYELNIRKFLTSKSQQKQDVEDIVQETFLKAHKVSDWAGVQNPEAYLVSIAKNAYKDHIRKETRNIVDSDVDITRLEIQDDIVDAETLVSAKQDYGELEDVIDSLTPRVKQAIILIKIMNVSYVEASEVMSISVGTLEHHITKGLAECRRKIKAHAKYAGLRSYDNTVLSFPGGNMPGKAKRNGD